MIAHSAWEPVDPLDINVAVVLLFYPHKLNAEGQRVLPACWKQTGESADADQTYADCPHKASLDVKDHLFCEPFHRALHDEGAKLAMFLLVTMPPSLRRWRGRNTCQRASFGMTLSEVYS